MSSMQLQLHLALIQTSEEQTRIASKALGMLTEVVAIPAVP